LISTLCCVPTMPIYEYQSENPDDPDRNCSICAKGFELQRPIEREALEKCPLCRRPVCKLVSRVNTKVATKEYSDSEAKSAGFHVLQKNCDGGYDKV
jgi:predicted nucleic acid-binding Zn ribbon protein